MNFTFLHTKCVVMFVSVSIHMHKLYLPNFVIVPTIWRLFLSRLHFHCCIVCKRLDTRLQLLAPIPSFPPNLHYGKEKNFSIFAVSKLSFDLRFSCCFVASERCSTNEMSQMLLGGALQRKKMNRGFAASNLFFGVKTLLNIYANECFSLHTFDVRCKQYIPHRGKKLL